MFQGPYCKEIVLNCIGAQLNSNMLESGWGHGHGYGPRLGSDRVIAVAFSSESELSGWQS